MSEQQRRNAVQILLTLDKKDYEEGMPVFEKYSTRGVIIRDGKIATQHGSAGDYKILGGGVEPGEKLEDALIREVGEESGLIVIPESIRPIGEIVERRRDLFEKNKIYVCHSCRCFRKCDKGSFWKFLFQILGEVFQGVGGYQFVCRRIKIVNNRSDRNSVLFAGVET